MKIIAFSTDILVARTILDHVGLPSTAWPMRPARDPPELEFAVDDDFDGVDIQDPA